MYRNTRSITTQITLFVSLILSLSFLSGCIVSKKATKITSDTYLVSVRGNAFASMEDAEIALLRKCAETTISNGCDSFLIVDQKEGYKKTYHASTNQYTGLTVNSYSKPRIRVKIKTFHGHAPGSYDAREVMINLGKE